MSHNGIILVGPPGSGKSTIGKAIAKHTDLIYVSSGDIARKLAKEDEITRDNLGRGLMANEEPMRHRIYCILYDIIYHRKQFILDGFPRNVDQLQWLRRHFKGLIFYKIETPYVECVERLTSRGRSDDSMEIIDNRMEYYRTYTEPMISSIGLIKRTIYNKSMDDIDIFKISGMAIGDIDEDC